jgi:putative two-component system response regulator
VFQRIGAGVLKTGHGDNPDRRIGYSSPEEDSLSGGTVLVIDDDQAVLGLLKDLLDLNGFRVQAALGGQEGLEVFQRDRFDLVITDIRMPNMDGLEVLKSVRERDDTVPVILVTGYGDLDYALGALREGAHDFLLKPINPEILLNTVRKGMEHAELRRFQRDYPIFLQKEVDARTEELKKSNETIRKIQGASVFALARLVESRDGETGYHLKRLQIYCSVLCAQLSQRERYSESMTEQFVEDLVQCSVLHDIGKVAIPDDILFYPGKFTDDEFEIMKQHTIAGGKALEEAALEVGEANNYLALGKDVACYHHERWDGTGYPVGLKGEDIPLSARIVALADVYDALTVRRRYKPAYSHVEALEQIRSERCKQFDPEIVDAFLEVQEEFRAIRRTVAADDENVENPAVQVCKPRE